MRYEVPAGATIHLHAGQLGEGLVQACQSAAHPRTQAELDVKLPRMALAQATKLGSFGELDVTDGNGYAFMAASLIATMSMPMAVDGCVKSDS